MEIAVLSDPLGSADYLAGWREVWTLDPAASLFQRPEYLAAWLPEFGGDREVFGIQMREGAAVAGIANLSRDADGVLRFAGDPDLTDYFGPLCAPGNRERVADALIDAALRIGAWRRFELTGLAADAGWVEPIARAAKGAGLVVQEWQHEVCPRIALPGDYDLYLASLDAKLRHEIKRKGRRLEREAGAYTIRVSDGSHLHADMERFFELHRTSSGPKGHFLHWGVAGFFILLARAFQERGWLRLSFLEVSGEPLAAVLSFTTGGVWSVYNSGYDHRRRDLGPGMVLMAETIRLAAEEGCATFDFLRGDEPYKYRFGAVDVPLVALTLSLQ